MLRNFKLKMCFICRKYLPVYQKTVKDMSGDKDNPTQLHLNVISKEVLTEIALSSLKINAFFNYRSLKLHSLISWPFYVHLNKLKKQDLTSLFLPPYKCKCSNHPPFSSVLVSTNSGKMPDR